MAEGSAIPESPGVSRVVSPGSVPRSEPERLPAWRGGNDDIAARHRVGRGDLRVDVLREVRGADPAADAGEDRAPAGPGLQAEGRHPVLGGGGGLARRPPLTRGRRRALRRYPR